MPQNEDSSTLRIVHVLLRLLRGDALSYDEMIAAYGKSERTYQRYLKEIRLALSEDMPDKLLPHGRDGADHFQIQSGDDGQRLAMALAVSNIILASRSMVMAEKNQLLEFVAAALDATEQAELKQYLLFPAGSYYPVGSSKPLLDLLLEVARHISAHERLTFSYQSSSGGGPSVHHGEPLSIYFDNMYFYVVFNSEEHQGFWMYRLDRIQEIISARQAHSTVHHGDFSMQRVREQSYLLALGETRTIQFRYWYWPQTALDRFPSSRIISRDEEDGSVVIEASVRFMGAKMWLLSQGPALQLLGPSDLVADMRTTVAAMMRRYQK